VAEIVKRVEAPLGRKEATFTPCGINADEQLGKTGNHPEEKGLQEGLK
jgi:hypothetical protein